MKRIVLLGATGSIGTQTLDVVRAFPERLGVLGLSAHRRVREVAAQAREFQPRFVTLTADDAAWPPAFARGADGLVRSARGAEGEDRSIAAGETDLDDLTLPAGCEGLLGEAGVERMVTDPAADIVVGAMVGAAGLRGAIAAINAGKTLALANKETLVTAGPVVMSLARARQVPILPVDSEHSAVFQCLRGGRADEVSRVVLTASGGPFRNLPLDAFPGITVEQALKHPTWTMGPKITVDSATMINKALEIIEAAWLFNLPADRIEVVIHPQSMIHSMVEFVDGSVLAQLSPPDMRLPIQYALLEEKRLAGPARRLNLAELKQWDFDRPDPRRYPALELGWEVVRRGGTAGATLNAANEVAVERFLAGGIRFVDIARLVRDVLSGHPYDACPDLDRLLVADRDARRQAEEWIP